MDYLLAGTVAELLQDVGVHAYPEETTWNGHRIWAVRIDATRTGRHWFFSSPVGLQYRGIEYLGDTPMGSLSVEVGEGGFLPRQVGFGILRSLAKRMAKGSPDIHSHRERGTLPKRDRGLKDLRS